MVEAPDKLFAGLSRTARIRASGSTSTHITSRCSGAVRPVAASPVMGDPPGHSVEEDLESRRHGPVFQVTARASGTAASTP